MGEDPQRLHDLLASERLLLTTEEAAELLRVGRTTIYALINAGDLHPVHIGRSCRLSRAELERYVRHLEAPQPVPPRSPARKRTSTNQGGLFELGPGRPVEEERPVHSRPASSPRTPTLDAIDR
jgi:excisionase family DNA binding protein